MNTKLLNDLIDCASIGDNDSGSIYIGEQVGLKTKNHINNVIINALSAIIKVK